ncbi:MAG: GNAT family N-acetyltransferase [Pseudomonadota bacterium]
MSVRIHLCQTPPDQSTHAQIEGLLDQYYSLIVQRMGDLGVKIDPAAPRSARAEFWANIADYLPPTGCLALAEGAAGRILGCGMLKTLSPGTGELKRLFVSQAARGTGAGRQLVKAREAEARRIGLTRLVADTLISNIEMQQLYPKLGFTQIAGPIETTTYLDQPMLRPHLLYFVKDLNAPSP